MSFPFPRCNLSEVSVRNKSSIPNLNRKKYCFSTSSNPNSFVFRSTLSLKEKTETLEHLMETVSEKLGLREQLEIIKIINPNARLLPTDTEFFIGEFCLFFVITFTEKFFSNNELYRVTLFVQFKFNINFSFFHRLRPYG